MLENYFWWSIEEKDLYQESFIVKGLFTTKGDFKGVNCLYPTNSVQKWCRDQDYYGLLLAIIQRVKELENMSDGEEKADTWHNCDDKYHLEKEIDKEKQKLKYFLDETDKPIKLRDYTETDIANRQVEKILGKLSDLISHTEEMKIDHDVSAQSVRQWKKDVKATYTIFLVAKEKLAKFLNNRQEEIYKKMERKQLEAKQEQKQEEEHCLTELCLAGENWCRIRGDT